MVFAIIFQSNEMSICQICQSMSICVFSNSNNKGVHCKICYISIKDKKAQSNGTFVQFWIYMKCKTMNHIYCKYIQVSKDLWYSISCCKGIFPFGYLANKSFFSFAYGSTTTIKKAILKISGETAA